MSMIEKITDIASAALPPVDESPRALRRWRFQVWMTQTLTIAFLAFHIAWACSLLPGLPGFAMAADVSGIKESVDELKRNLLEKAIFDTRIRQCEAMKQGNGRVYTEQLRAFLIEYHELTGAAYPLPACDEL